MGRSLPRRWLNLLLVTVLGAVATVFATPTPARAMVGDLVLYWNDVLLRAYRDVGGAPTALARAGAMMHAAIYDAYESSYCVLDNGPDLELCEAVPYLKLHDSTNGAVPDFRVAVTMAASGVLSEVFPTLSFTADRSAVIGGLPKTPSYLAGQEVGTESALTVELARDGDGSTDATAYPDGTAPGQWRRTGSGEPATPNWGRVTPFTLTSASQFRPPLPGGYPNVAALLASPEYATQVDEVQRLGAVGSTERTADQTETAWFWANDLNGTYKPPGQLYAHTRIVSEQQGLDERANAKLFMLVALSMGDAAIGAWGAKYESVVDLWRPESAIQLAATDGNPATVADPTWQPLSADTGGTHFSPPFPAYVSGHATFAGAWAGAMRNYFGTDNITFTATTEDPHAVGVQRTFTSFSAAAEENALSRIYLGVHYRWDADHGLALGHQIADHVAANYSQAA